ncbi:hypothetical protein HA402_001269 [Bradysia odoriphaga]|nr:hypothetical protein HA402_001269 [Bradysia odoriphaga]
MNGSKPRINPPGNKSDWANLTEIDKNLLEALDVKDFDKVDKLIQSGANVNVRFGQIKDSALHYFDSIDTVTKLIECGASVSASNRYHESPLTYACKFGRHRDIIKILMSNGAYVNKQVKFGKTKAIPLTLALEAMKAMNDDIDLDLVEELLYYGANVDFGKMFSFSPFITALNSSPELARLMIKYSVLKIWDKYRFLRMGCVERRYVIATNNSSHLPYLEECSAEAERMKEEMFNTWHSLYDICRGSIYFNTYTGPFSSFLDSYKTEAFKQKYPIYINVLLRRFEFLKQKRLTLLRGLDGIRITPKIKISKKNTDCKRLTALNTHCLRHIATFLTNSDVERMVRAAQ